LELFNATPSGISMSAFFKSSARFRRMNHNILRPTRTDKGFTTAVGPTNRHLVSWDQSGHCPTASALHPLSVTESFSGHRIHNGWKGNSTMAKINDPRISRSAEDSFTNEGGRSFGDNGRRNVSGSDDRESGLREQADQFVAQNPYSSVLTGFGIGFGFGLVVTLLLSRREETWYERHIPDSLQEWPGRLKKVPETVASQVSQAWNRW
jgi:hypothetical protein